MKKKAKKKLYIFGGAIIFFVVIFLCLFYFYENREKVLEIYCIYEKGGTVYLIRTPNDKRILVNGGQSSEVIRELTKILPFYSRRVDTLIIQYPDYNHVSGLVDIAKRYKISKIIIPAVTPFDLGFASSSDVAYTALLDIAHKKGIEIQSATYSDKYVLDNDIGSDIVISINSKRIYLNILFPFSSSTFQYSKSSSPQLFFEIIDGNNNFSFLGKATGKIQKSLIMSSSSNSALIFDINPSASNINRQFWDNYKPDYLIYSKVDGRSTGKIKKDPLEGYSSQNLFNVRNFEWVRLVSRSSGIEINTR